MHSLEYVAIGAAVLALILYRQLRTRRVRADRAIRMTVVLGAIGLVETVLYVKDHHVGGLGIGALAASLATAAALAVWRANTMRVWRDATGDWLRKGMAGTVTLWLLAMGLHIGIDTGAAALAGGGDASGLSGLAGPSALLFLAVSLGLQNAVLARRVQWLAAAGRAAHADVAV